VLVPGLLTHFMLDKQHYRKVRGRHKRDKSLNLNLGGSYANMIISGKFTCRESEMGTRIILADDHQIILEGLARFIAEEPDLEVVGVAKDGLALVDLADGQRPDVAIVDISLPGIDGIEATTRMLTNNPDLKVIALSMHQDMMSLVSMLRAGAKGYISKSNASQELIRAIRAVSAGFNYLCPELTTALVEVFLVGLGDKEYSPAPALTPREREVLRMLAEGAGSKEIAFDLGLSPKTVDAHRHNIMTKLGVDSVAALVKYALCEGLIQP